MLIIIVGTPLSGKNTIARYLERKHNFTKVVTPDEVCLLGKQDALIQEPLSFPSTKAFLETVTRHWRSNFVTTSITNENDLVAFMKRPSVLVVAVDGPMMTRWKRQQLLCGSLKCNHLRHIGPDQDPEEFTLENFVTNNDFLMHNGPRSEYSVSFPEFGTSLRKLISHAHLTIMNSFETIEELEKHLDEIDLLDAERLRPGWDQYFMTLASLASLRSNCMKRRVGAILVRSKRILSTGYNGTPRGVTNCNEGGCGRCNGSSRGGENMAACLCLHAEENALLEAGRERIGEDSVIYCNTCPCLTCSVKIVQCGVREVVYNLSYAMDDASAKILKEGGVKLRRMEVRREIA